MLPPSLQGNNLHQVCLILEGYEEEYYFKKILDFPCFKGTYEIKQINAKTASNIPAIYQQEYSKNKYAIVLVVCDKDRKPEQYDRIIEGIDSILGPGNAKEVVTFISPCTLQVILSHFGDVKLETQAKKTARPVVEALTGVKNYDAHKEQLDAICKQIYLRTYPEMKQRVASLSTDPNDLPSTNILALLGHLESSDVSWIERINTKLSEDSETE
jgi:hypothetical protein